MPQRVWQWLGCRCCERVSSRFQIVERPCLRARVSRFPMFGLLDAVSHWHCATQMLCCSRSLRNYSASVDHLPFKLGRGPQLTKRDNTLQIKQANTVCAPPHLGLIRQCPWGCRPIWGALGRIWGLCLSKCGGLRPNSGHARPKLGYDRPDSAGVDRIGRCSTKCGFVRSC